MRKLPVPVVFCLKFVWFVVVQFPVFVVAFVNKAFNHTKKEKIDKKGQHKNNILQKLDETYMTVVYLAFAPLFAVVLFPFALIQFLGDFSEYNEKNQ